MSAMVPTAQPDWLLHVFRETLLSTVRADTVDLSARQLAILLTVYLANGPHTVRALAAELNVSRPAISKALDRLAEFDLTRRRPDPHDGRSIIVGRTATGGTYLHNLRLAIAAAALPTTARFAPASRSVASSEWSLAHPI
jgi:DNA-binding MarR family transcriptional regulator